LDQELNSPRERRNEPHGGHGTAPLTTSLSNRGEEYIRPKTLLVGAVVGLFLVAGVFVTFDRNALLGKGIAFAGSLILCFAYPAFTLIAYILSCSTLPLMGSGIPQVDYIFIGIMAMNIAIQYGGDRGLGVSRSIVIPFVVYCVVLLKGVIFPTIWSTEPAGDVLGIVGFVLAVALVRSERDRGLLGIGLVLQSAVLSVWTVRRLGGGHAHLAPTFDVRGFTRGDLFDPNLISLCIGFGLMIGLAALLDVRGMTKKFLVLPLLGYIAVATWALGLLASRGVGPIAIVVATMIMLTAHFGKPLKSLAALLVLLGLAFLVSQLPAFSLLSLRFGEQQSFATASGRTVLWGLGLDHVFAAGPLEFLFGAGGGASKGVAGNVMHNQFLEALVDYGVLGLASLTWFLWGVTKNAFSRSNRMRTVSVGLVTYLLLACLSLVPFTTFSSGWLSIALLALSPYSGRPEALQSTTAPGGSNS